MTQNETWPYRRFLFVSIPLSLLAIGLLYVFFPQRSLTLFFYENGPVENLQAVFLLITALLSLVAYLKIRVPLYSLLAVGMCAFSIFFFIREMPSCESLFPVLNPEICIMRIIKRTITYSVAVALVAYSVCVYMRHRNIIPRFFHPRFSWPVLPFAICLLGSKISDKYPLLWLEETLELNAYAMMLVISWQLMADKSHR